METGATDGIVNPGGTDTKPAPPGAVSGGLGALAANTLPILKQDYSERTWWTTAMTLNSFKVFYIKEII